MSSAHAKKVRTRHDVDDRLSRDNAGCISVALVWSLVVGMIAFLRRDSRESKSGLVEGTIQDTRIVADHALQMKWGGQITWRADYRIGYTVRTREYSVWIDSGIRGENEADVRLSLPRPLPTCRVRYSRQKPEESVAECP